MSSFLRILLLGAAITAGTMAVGWWALPVTTFAWGLVASRTRRPVFVATLAAILGWGVLLAWDASGESFRLVASGMGNVLKINGPAFIELVLLYPALVGFASSGAAHALMRED
ncbi:MAG: hypothetical protein HY275_05905 [Gemmatimonadetes bacterium]|nr:hypothetical protein [Gemmatimonadota bacterium]